MINTWVIVAAAGSGVRLGKEIPKAFVPLGSSTILETTLASLKSCGVSNVIVSLPKHYPVSINAIDSSGLNVLFVDGGERRQDSVLNAALALPDSVEMVLIHDAARPYVVPDVFHALVEGAREFGSCMPVLPCADTLKRVKDSKITHTVNRAGVFRIQTPQAFRIDVFRKMIQLYQTVEVTDDCAISEKAGYEPHAVSGSAFTFKITTLGDLELAEQVNWMKNE